jgi:hypothetical protein
MLSSGNIEFQMFNLIGDIVYLLGWEFILKCVEDSNSSIETEKFRFTTKNQQYLFNSSDRR